MVSIVLMAILLFFVPSMVLAQEVSDTEEVTVVAPYEPSVSDAFKINVSPKIPDENMEKPEFDYNIKPKTIQSPVSLEPIKPAKIMGESVTKLYKNYVKAGFGNYWTPYLEMYANTLRSKKNAFGVYVKYLSSSGNIDGYGFPGSSSTGVSAYGKKFMNKHTLTASTWYKRSGVHYYGYKTETLSVKPSKKDIKQSYNLFGMDVAFESNYTKDNKFNHYIDFKYYYFYDRFESNENNILFTAGLNKNTSFFNFSDHEKLGFDAKVDYYFNKDTLQKNNAGIFKLEPFYDLAFSQYSFKIGFNIEVESGSVTYLHFYPVVRIEVKVVKDFLVTYAGVYGEMHKNSFKSLSDENPFIISTIEKRFTNDVFSQYGGIKGHLTKYFDYNLSFVNTTVENMPFFVNDTTSALGEGLNNQFTLVHDRVKYSRVIAEFGFHYKNKFNAMLRGKYNNYFLDNEDKPWHKPTLEIMLSADYSLQEKILIKADLFTFNKMYARTFETKTSGTTTTVTEVPVEIGGKVDLNLGVEYRYSKVLSGFINFNNILGQRYFNWYNYPSYKFNVLLGVTYSF